VVELPEMPVSNSGNVRSLLALPGIWTTKEAVKVETFQLSGAQQPPFFSF